MAVEEFGLKDRLEYTDKAALTGLEKMMMPGQRNLFKVEGTEISNVTPDDYKKNGWLVAAHITGLVLLNVVALVSFVVLVIIRANLHLTEKANGYDELGEDFAGTPLSEDYAVSEASTPRGKWDLEIAEIDDQERAGLYLQARYRGLKARRAFDQQNAASTTMQALVRGGIARKEVRMTKRIQAHFRGMAARGDFQKKKELSSESKRKAPSIFAELVHDTKLLKSLTVLGKWNPLNIKETPVWAITHLLKNSEDLGVIEQLKSKLRIHRKAQHASLVSRFTALRVDPKHMRYLTPQTKMKNDLVIFTNDKGRRQFAILKEHVSRSNPALVEVLFCDHDGDKVYLKRERTNALIQPEGYMNDVYERILSESNLDVLDKLVQSVDERLEAVQLSRIYDTRNRRYVSPPRT